MEKEAKHLLAGEGDSQEEYPFADRLLYRRRSRLSNVPWLALLCSFLMTIFFMSLTILLSKTIFGYEIVIRPHGLAKDADLMMYCMSSAAKSSFLVPYCFQLLYTTHSSTKPKSPHPRGGRHLYISGSPPKSRREPGIC